MSMLGNLSEIGLPDLFQMFERSGKTGQLSVWSATGIHRIIFCQGRIVAAIAPDSQYALKALVHDLGSLSEPALKELKSLSKLTQPLGKLLKQKQIVDGSLLASAFRKQIQIAIYPLFNVESGQFRFSEKTPIPYAEMTGMSQSSTEIAMNALRKCEANFPVYHDLPSPESRWIRVDPELPLFKLSGIEWSVLENVSPEYRISDLRQLLKFDLLEVQQACCRLSKVSLLKEVPVKANPQPKPSKSEESQDVSSMAHAMKQRLQNTVSSPQRPEKPAVTTASSNKTAVSPNLLSRVASMLKGT